MKIRPAALAAGFTYGYAALRLVQMLGPRPEPVADRDAKRYGTERRAYLVGGIVRSLTGLAATAFVSGDAIERSLAPLPRPLRVPAFVATLGTLVIGQGVALSITSGSSNGWINVIPSASHSRSASTPDFASSTS